MLQYPYSSSFLVVLVLQLYIVSLFPRYILDIKPYL